MTAAAIGAVTLIVFLAWLLHRARRQPSEQPRAGRGADALTRAAALIATIVAGQGMWQFLDRIIGDVPWFVRVLMFAFLEIAVITSAVRARRSMRENYSAGIDGMAVWVLTSVSAVLAAMEAASLPEALFRLAAPLVAAWLWERGMAIERRRLRGRSAIHWRFTLERVMVWLGLAEAKNRTADQVDTQRRLTRIALAAQRARDLRQAGAAKWRQRRALKALKRAVSSAEEHIGLGGDPAKQETLRDQIAALYSVEHLLDVTAASAWTKPAPAPEDVPESEFGRLARETRDLNEALSARAEARELVATATSLFAAATGHHVVPVTPGVTVPLTPADVTSPVMGGVIDTSPLAPFLPSGGASDMTADVTSPVTAETVTQRVTPPVMFDVTDPSVFDLPWPPPDLQDLSSIVIDDMTPGDVNDPVTPESKTAVMRAHWDAERAEDRYPRVSDLARVADADPALASRNRAKWVKELPWWERRKADPRREKTTA